MGGGASATHYRRRSIRCLRSAPRRSSFAASTPSTMHGIWRESRPAMDWDEIAMTVGYMTMALVGGVLRITVVIGLIAMQRGKKQPGTVRHLETETLTAQQEREIEELEHLYQL